MFEFNKYHLFEVQLDRNSQHRWKEWYQKVGEALALYTKGQKTTYITVGSDTSQSIAYDLSHPVTRKIASTRYLTGVIDTLTPELAAILVSDAEFYLGHGILINGSVTEKQLFNLIITWETEISQSGVEFFKMQADGYSFCWYNPSNPDEAQKQLKELFSDLNDAPQR